ncbi:MAG: L-2-hydroxyglutarate oxidase [Bacteroidetes bacterium]|nr:L-2-hydroxyglutarate oxidase [Bacteroidota bacterium]
MNYDIVVVGGGIVGLATAYQTLMARPGTRLAVLEKEGQLAKHQTGNNSGVIHSGLYYKPGSLKATNCIGGYHMLLNFCNENSIEYDLCGKVVVATEQKELPILKGLFERGQQNGLDNLKMLSPEEIKEIEPHCTGLAGIRVPQTGIINYTKVCLKLAEKISEMGGEIHLNQKVKKIDCDKGQEIIHTDNQTYTAKLLVNCAGLYSDKVTKMSTRVDAKIIPFRGEYYELKPEKAGLVKHLIYPVPDPNFPFLGVHFTRMIEGGVEAGPNAVLAYAREGYTKSIINWGELAETLTYPGFVKVAMKYWKTGLGEVYRSYSKKAFAKALQKLIPEITVDDLKPGGAGIRAQACERSGGLLDDFKIIEARKSIKMQKPLFVGCGEKPCQARYHPYSFINRKIWKAGILNLTRPIEQRFGIPAFMREM